MRYLNIKSDSEERLIKGLMNFESVKEQNDGVIF